MNSTTSNASIQVIMIALASVEAFMYTLRFVPLLSNLVNILVLTNAKLKDPIFKYLRATAIADFLYCACILPVSIGIIFCGVGYGRAETKCGPNIYKHFFILYIALDEYATSCLALFSILVEIFLTIQRICVITNTRSLAISSKVKQVTLLILIVSFLAYTPTLGMYELNSYRITRSRFGRSQLAVAIQTVLGTLRLCLVLVVLFALNIVTIVKLRAFLNAKLRLRRNRLNLVNLRSETENKRGGLTSQSRTSTFDRPINDTNVTVMVIATSFLYILGNLAHFALYVRKKVFNMATSQSMWLYLASQYSIIVFLSSKLIVYYCFNRHFRSVLNSYLTWPVYFVLKFLNTR
jgi:hypothetical protein